MESLREELRTFALIGDDFAYIAESRDWPTTVAHLWEPHNTHVVPVFRLWTFALVTLAGRLENLPMVLAAASYVGLIAAMLAMGYLVARETGRATLGLSAMAILGISTVTHPAVTWFSAGQALWAGTAVLLTLVFARSWSAKGGVARFVAVILGVTLAPALWSGGLVAGPAAIAYLVARNESRVRRQVLLLTVITSGALLLILSLSRSLLPEVGIVWERHEGLWPRPIQGLFHTAQAIVEVCLFANLGIDAMTVPVQAVATLVALTALYAWSRGGRGRINPLEASGAVVVIGSCLLTFMLRGNFPFSSLRSLGWYYAIPQIGAILFASGWWTALSAPGPTGINPRQAGLVLALVVVFGLIQVPRGQRRVILDAPPFAPNEETSFPTIGLRLVRAIYFRAESHDRQVRALARLDQVNRILLKLHASPESLRDLLGRVLIPGIPDKQLGTDAFSILAPRPPDPDTLADLPAVLPRLLDLLEPEPPPRPFWLDPNDPTARAVRKTSSGPQDGVQAP